MDRLIRLQKANSIPALKRLINEAVREIGENAVRKAVANFNRRVHLCIRNNGIFNLIKCQSSLFLSIFFLSTLSHKHSCISLL